MTLQEIIDRTQRIADYARDGDPEAAHALEDQLHLDVLKAIADSAEAPQAQVQMWARAAAATAKISFARHCA